MNIRQLKLSVLMTAVVLTIAVSPFVRAAMPDVSAFHNAAEIDDLELGIQRGRYVGRGQIVYFGVEMNTEWRTASGEVYRAGLNLGVDRHPGRFRPVITVERQTHVARTSTTSSPATTAPARSAAPPTISSGGLDTVKGVGQVVQVTGDTNSVRNDISVTLRTAGSSSASAATTATSAPGQSSSTAGSGAVAQSGNDNKSIGVSVTVPGQGVATQSITGLGGLHQNVRLTGDMNSVLNQLNLTAEFRAVSSPGMRQMRSSFQSLRGLPQAGGF